MLNKEILKRVEEGNIGFDEDWKEFCFSNDNSSEIKVRILNKEKDETLQHFLNVKIRPELERFKKDIDSFDVIEKDWKYYLVKKSNNKTEILYQIKGIDEKEFKKLTKELNILKSKIKSELSRLKKDVERKQPYIFLTKEGVNIDVKSMSLEELFSFLKTNILAYKDIEPILFKKIERLYNKLWWDWVYEYALRIKQENKDLYYEIIKFLVLKVSNKQQYEKIISLSPDDLSNIFKRFTIDKEFIKYFSDIYAIKNFNCKGNISKEDCHMIGSFYFYIRQKYNLANNNYLDDILLHFAETQQGKVFINQLREILKNTTDIMDTDDLIWRKIHTKWVIGALQDWLNQFPEGNQTFKEIVLFVAQIAPIFAWIYALIKLVTKGKWWGLGLLVEELIWQATKGISLIEILWKFYYWWLDEEFNRLKWAKKSIELTKAEEVYKEILSYPAFVDFIIWDLKIKDIKKFFKIENGKYQIKNFDEFLKQFPVGDIRRELLLKFKDQVWVKWLNKIFDLGLNRMGLLPNKLDDIISKYWDKKIDDYFNQYQEELRKQIKEKQKEKKDSHISWNAVPAVWAAAVIANSSKKEKKETNDDISSSKNQWVIHKKKREKSEDTEKSVKWSDKTPRVQVVYSKDNKEEKENLDLVDKIDNFLDNLTQSLFFENWYGGFYVLVRWIQTGAVKPENILEYKSWTESKWFWWKFNYFLEWPAKIIDKFNGFNKSFDEATKKWLYDVISKDLEAINRWLKTNKTIIEQHWSQIDNLIANIKRQKKLLEDIKQAIGQNDITKLNRLVEEYTQNFDNSFRTWFERVSDRVHRLSRDVEQKKNINLEWTYRQIERKLQSHNLSFSKGDIFEITFSNNEKVVVWVIDIDSNTGQPIFGLVENGKLTHKPVPFNINSRAWNNRRLPRFKYLGNYFLEWYIAARDKVIEHKILSAEELDKQYEQLKQEREQILNEIKKKEEELAKKYNGKIPESEKEALRKELVQKITEYNSKMAALNIQWIRALERLPWYEQRKSRFLDIFKNVNKWIGEKIKENKFWSRTIFWIWMVSLLWAWKDEILNHPFRAGVDIGVGFIPLAGNIRDLFWAAKGVDPVNWEKMPTSERIIRGIFAIPIVGNMAKVVKMAKYWKEAHRLEEAVKDAKNIDEITEKITKFDKTIELINKTAKFAQIWTKLVTYSYIGVSAASAIVDMTDLVKNAVPELWW